MAIPRKRKRPDSFSNVSPSQDAAVYEIFQVEDINPSTLRHRIRTICRNIKNGRKLRLPARKPENLVYVPELDRVCMKNSKDLVLSDISAKRIFKFLLFFEIIYNLSYEEKKQMCYVDKDLFGSQHKTDDIIDDACCCATRRSLKIQAAETGWVIGSLVIKENGKIFDLSNHDILGRSICPSMFDFDIILCDAKFILVVEKYVSYSKLINTEFHKKVPCIIITGNGMPDVATRFFLRNLTKKLHNRLPVLALMDSDPHGVEIMSIYRCGSENLAFDNENLATPHINWIWVRPSDWDTYCGSSNMIQSMMNPSEVTYTTSLRERECFRNKTSWVKELDKMLNTKKKYDLDTLSSTNLLRKLSLGDWLTADGDLKRKYKCSKTKHKEEIILRKEEKCEGEGMDVEMVDAPSAIKETKTCQTLIAPKATVSKTLYMGNLSYSIEENDIKEFFKDVGQIIDVRFAFRDDQFAGYGHVEFATVEAAREALKRNNETLKGRLLQLDFAKERGAFFTSGGGYERRKNVLKR